MTSESSEIRRRWRLVLGSQAQKLTNSVEGESSLNLRDRKRDEALDYLYGRERSQNASGHDSTTGDGGNRGAGLDPTRILPTLWLKRVRQIFPDSTVETLQKHAVDRYHLTSLLTDPEVLRQRTPDIDLVQTLLQFRNHLDDRVMSEVRRIIRCVCDDLERRLSQKILSQFSAVRQRHLHGGRRLLSNLDWHRTVTRNLKHYQPQEESLVLERLYFYRRAQHQVPWDIYLLIDQSGSMVDSVIHAAVLGAIFCRLKALRTRLLAFDTEVVDLSGLVDDPVETLLAVQLGGGTDIAHALVHTEQQITRPDRSIIVVVSDFDEGGSVSSLLTCTQRLRDSGVRLLGLTALSNSSEPMYNEAIARDLATVGMDIGALTPDRLAQWIAGQLETSR